MASAVSEKDGFGTGLLGGGEAMGCSVEAMGRGWAHCSSPSKRCMAGATKSRAAPARTLSLRLVLLPKPTPPCGFLGFGSCKAWCKEQTNIYSEVHSARWVVTCLATREAFHSSLSC